MRALRIEISLRGRLLLLVILAVLPAFVLIALSAREDWAGAETTARRHTRQLAAVVAGEQNRLIGEARQMLIMLTNLPLVRDADMLPRCGTTLDRLRKLNPLYANIGMVDAQGNLLCSALPFKPPVNFADRAWFRRAVASRDFAVGDYLVGRLTGIPSVGLAYPVFDAAGTLQKVVYATIDLAWLQNLAATLELPAGAAVVVVDAQGTVLARHPDRNREWMGKPAPEAGQIQAILASGCTGFAEFHGQDGVLRLNAIEPLQQVGGRCVYVRVGVPRDDVYAPIEQQLRRNLAATILISLLVLAAAWFGSEWFVLRRVHALTRAAQRFGEGDLAARTGLPHSGEDLGRLARGFDEMAAGLQEREARLEAADRALTRANRALTVLSAGNRTMLRATDEQALLEDMCRMIVDKAGYPMAWVGYREDDAAKSIRMVAHSGFAVSILDPRCLTWDVQASGRAPAGAAIRSGRPALLRRGDDPAPLSCMAESGCTAALALPLTGEADVFGVLTVFAAEAEAFAETEVELLAEAAADLAFGIARLRDQARRKEAEAANRIKSEFLANMSHELRTPLNAIIGFSEVMKDGLMGDMTPEQHEYVADIFTSGRHLLSLINDILDLSKIEAGKMALDLENTAVATLLENSLSVIREKAAAHRIALTQEIQGELEPVQIDARKTKQIVYNLLSNAVKFTPDGGRVVLRARRVGRDAVERWASDQPNSMRLPLPAGDADEFLEIAVEDTGIGIGRADAPRLFQPFSQLDSSLARRYEGTGLGLAMVMKMAGLHGGTVAVNSEPGQGSCFTVWLPWREAGATAPQPEAAACRGPRGRLALVVEDNDAAAALVKMQLEAEDMDVVRTASAEEALALEATQRPDVIVLDIFLPGMDGWDFLARIKQPDSPWRDVPVVIASIAADAQRGFSLGATQVLQKPVGREDLAAALHRLGLVPPRANCKVLIVDDDPKAVELLAAYLAEPGYRVLRAYGGREGIDAAQRELPQLMVLDLMMPEVSGFAVVEALRANAGTARIPIIVVTAKELTPEDRAVLNGHAAAVLEKASFNHGRFLVEVRRALGWLPREGNGS